MAYVFTFENTNMLRESTFKAHICKVIGQIIFLIYFATQYKKMSCHKINIIFIFTTSSWYCSNRVERMI